MWIIDKNWKRKAYFSIYDINGNEPNDDNIIALFRIDTQTGSEYAHSREYNFGFKKDGRKFILLEEINSKDRQIIIERVFREPMF